MFCKFQVKKVAATRKIFQQNSCSKENSSISSNTVSKYLSTLEDAFVISKVRRYDVKGRKYIVSLCEYYFGDLGIRNAVVSFRQFKHLKEVVQ